MYKTPAVISEAHLALTTVLSDDDKIAKKQVDELVIIVGDLVKAKGEVYYELHQARQRALLPQQKGQTELDRNVYMKAGTARQQADYDMLSDFIESSLTILVWSRVRLSLNKK